MCSTKRHLICLLTTIVFAGGNVLAKADNEKAIVRSTVEPGWEMPGIRGNPRDGAAPGKNWMTNPFVEDGGSWAVYHEVENRFEQMVFGRAWKFAWVWREPGDSFSPRSMLLGKKLQAAGSTKPGTPGPASLVTFTPPRGGDFSVSVKGIMELKKGSPAPGRARLGVFDATPTLRRELVRADLKDGGIFAWEGATSLKEGESVGLQLETLHAPSRASGWTAIAIERFNVKEKGSSRFAAPLPAVPGEWTPRDAHVTIKPCPDGGMTLEIPPGTQEWYVLDGPSLVLPARTRFSPDRSISVTGETWPENPGNTPITGYAMHLRARMSGGETTARSTDPGTRAPVSGYAQSLRARRFWPTVWELADADKMTSWTTVSGAARIAPACDRLDFELWLAVPRGAPATVHLREFQIRESFSETHLLTPKPAALGNIFFADRGTMQVEFARAEQVERWGVIDRDETGRTQKELTGKGAPGVVTLPLDTPGLHRTEAKAVYLDGATVVSRTTAATVGEPLPDEIRLRSRFGLARVHGNRPLWKKSGARWEWGIGKIQLKDWILEKDGSIRPPADWQPLTGADGFTDLLSVGSFPAWLYAPEYTGDRRDLHPPKDWKLYEALFEAFARANPGLRRFSTYNEANAKWRGTSEEFLKFQALMARGARQGNPKIEVSGPGDFSINLESFQRYVQRGMFGTNGLNGVNIHAYIGETPPEGEFIDRVIGMCEMLKGAGFGDLPIYITEFGWSRGSNAREHPIPNPDDHPRYVARSLALLTAQPIDAIVWHCMRHSGPTVKGEDELGYQLLNTDHTPSASYVAYVNAVKWLSEIERGNARWFRISPRLNLVLGRTRDRIVGVAWCTEGEAPFELPGEPLRAVDMMGREIAPDRHATLSPSPIFFELSPDNSFIDLPAKPALTGYPGQTLDTGLDRLTTPVGIAAVGSTAAVSKEAMPGTYLLAGYETGTQRRVLQPLTIPPPLVLQSLDQVLSADCRALEVVATVMPSIPGAAQATLTLATGETLTAEAPIAPGDVCRISVPVPSFEVGKRIEGDLRIDTIGDIPFSVGGKVDTSALPAVRVEGRPDWDRIPATDFSAWAPSKKLAPEDCSATVQAVAANDGLHIRVAVNDDIHRQTRPLRAIWQEDSIQFAFDVDADKPWQFNLILDGRCNGHRVFYYDICRPSDGRAVIVWRNRADCPGFGAQCLAPEVTADIRRESARTVYDIVFPWKSLDLEQAPPIGTQFGFALVVNDADKGYDRRVLRFGHGIAGPQNPELYATMKIVPAVVQPAARPRLSSPLMLE